VLRTCQRRSAAQPNDVTTTAVLGICLAQSGYTSSPKDMLQLKDPCRFSTKQKKNIVEAQVVLLLHNKGGRNITGDRDLRAYRTPGLPRWQTKHDTIFIQRSIDVPLPCKCHTRAHCSSLF